MRRVLSTSLMLVFVLASTLMVSLRASTPTARPEEVGLSTERLKRVTELMQRHIDGRTFSGAVTLIARNGRIAHFDAQGLMDLDSKKAMQKDAIFRIMSMTKPIVGASILMLVEEGKIRLTDPVSKFIPELKELKATVLNTDGTAPPAPSGAVTAPLPGKVVDASREITVRDLLTHTSGLMSGGASAALARDVVSIKANENLAQVMPRLKAVPLDFQPGTRWAYSGQYGFDVLARIVEVASGMTVDRFTKQRIFDPLGMKDTHFYPAEGPRVVTLYQQVDGQLRKQPNAAHMNGAYFSGGGGLLSTAEDYLQFALMLLNGGQLDGKRLMSARTVDVMTTVFAPDSLPGRLAGEGFGLSVRVVTDPAARNTFVSKGSFGWSGAYNTHFFIDPKERIVGIFMTQVANLQSRGEIRNDFETAVMQAIVGGPAISTGTN